MRLVVVTGTLLERDAILRELGSASLARLPPFAATRVAHPGIGTVVVLPAGPGVAAAATAAAVGANRLSPDLVVSMGLAGALGDAAAAGSAVLADPIVAAEVIEGADSLADEPDAEPVGAYEAPRPQLELARARLATEFDVLVGPLLTVTTPSRDPAQARDRAQRHPDALAEATGGYGAAVAAAAHRVPTLEARAVGYRAGSPDTEGAAAAALETLTVLAQTLFARDWASTSA